MSLVERSAGTVALDAEGGLGSVGDFFALMKPRVMSLVIFTALVGMVMAPGGIHPLLGLISVVAVAVGAGASGALNMWYDADIDGRMSRTSERPVPAGRVTPDEALVFGMVLSIGSVLVLGFAANALAAGLLAFTIFFYAVVYTMWLKRRTPLNIVIGGAAGAFPPMIGWAAATDAVSLQSVVLFLIIFMWTPPHFWALALLKSDDYARAGVPMLPVTAGPTATRNQILVYSLLLAPIGVLPTILGFAGVAYGVVAGIAGAVFVARAWRVRQVSEGPEARKACGRLFGYSILYLFLVYAMLLGEHLVLQGIR
jgi:protoheme IX farnesyltransferase